MQAMVSLSLLEQLLMAASGAEPADPFATHDRCVRIVARSQPSDYTRFFGIPQEHRKASAQVTFAVRPAFLL